MMRKNMRPSRETGAKAVELSIAIPLIIFVLYGLIYFSITLTSTAVLNSVANDTLRELITNRDFGQMPDMSQSCSTYDGQECDSFSGNEVKKAECMACEGLEILKQQLTSRLTESFIGANESSSAFVYLTGDPEIDIPRPDASVGTTGTQAYDLQPIVVRVEAAMKPFFPGLAPIKIRGQAAGYRELHDATSYQILTTCEGIPYDYAGYEVGQQVCQCTARNESPSDPTRLDSYYVDGEGITRCEPCAFHAIPTYMNQPDEDGNYPFFKPTQNPPQRNGCDCPTDAYCQKVYGPKASGAGAWHGCRCQCTKWRNAKVGESGLCDTCSGEFNIPAGGASSGFNMIPDEITGELAGIIQGPSGYTVKVGMDENCQCIVTGREGALPTEDTWGNPIDQTIPSGDKLTTQDCALLYPNNRKEDLGVNSRTCSCFCQGCGTFNMNTGNTTPSNNCNARAEATDTGTSSCRCGERHQSEAAQKVTGKNQCECKDNLTTDDKAQATAECIAQNKPGQNKYYVFNDSATNDGGDCGCKLCDDPPAGRILDTSVTDQCSYICNPDQFCGEVAGECAPISCMNDAGTGCKAEVTGPDDFEDCGAFG